MSSTNDHSTSSTSSNGVPVEGDIQILYAPHTNNISSTECHYDSTAETLRRNDKSDGTTLDLDSALDFLEENLEDLLDGIGRNTTITSLQLEGHLLCQLTPDDGRRLLDALGGLPALTKLHLHNYVGDLPLTLLTVLIERARGLRGITLHTAQLAGRTEAQGDEFAHALGNLPCLESFKCSNAILAGGLSLEKLIATMSGISTLQKVEIELESGGTLSCPALRALCECPKLRELRLWRMTLHPQHLILVAGLVQDNDTIKHLELGEMGYADHAVESYAAVAQMLRHNSKLENFGMINFSGLDDKGCILMANALEENATLTEINVRGCDQHVLSQEAAQAVAQMFSRNQTLRQWGMNTVGVKEQGAASIARALAQDNSTLRTLMLQRIVGDVHKGNLALHDMLKTNVTLTRVYPEAIGHVKREMDFWLLLNNLKLRHVHLSVDSTGRTEFLGKLISHRHNLDVCFYLLSSNPYLLH